MTSPVDSDDRRGYIRTRGDTCHWPPVTVEETHFTVSRGEEREGAGVANNDGDRVSYLRDEMPSDTGAANGGIIVSPCPCPVREGVQVTSHYDAAL